MSTTDRQRKEYMNRIFQETAEVMSNLPKDDRLKYALEVMRSCVVFENPRVDHETNTFLFDRQMSCEEFIAKFGRQNNYHGQPP